MAKIAFFEADKDKHEIVTKALAAHEISFIDHELTIADLPDLKKTEIIAVRVTSKVSDEIINSMPNLKLISTMSTGFDHIDLETCKAKNITVCNIPFYGENTVAEHAMALMLALSRNIHKSYVKTLRGDFTQEDVCGFDLKGKTLGIIGGGHIGMHVAKMAKGFGMNVIVFDIYHNDELPTKIGFEYVAIDPLFKNSDIITLHVPYNKHTHHLVNPEKIALMKQGALLINTARGGVVDTDAMHKALISGKLGGAGLDVIEGEELIREKGQLYSGTETTEEKLITARNNTIFHLSNVIFTPHNAYNSLESRMRRLDTTVENINAYLKGEPQNIVGR